LARLAAIQKVCVLHLLGFGDNKIKELVFANEEMGQLREKKEPWT